MSVPHQDLRAEENAEQCRTSSRGPQGSDHPTSNELYLYTTLSTMSERQAKPSKESERKRVCEVSLCEPAMRRLLCGLSRERER